MHFAITRRSSLRFESSMASKVVAGRVNEWSVELGLDRLEMLICGVCGVGVFDLHASRRLRCGSEYAECRVVAGSGGHIIRSMSLHLSAPKACPLCHCLTCILHDVLSTSRQVSHGDVRMHE